MVKNKWKIAWCHHGDAGGSKRAAFEMVRELSKRGHIIDEFIIRDAEPALDYLPLKEFVRNSFVTVLENSKRELRPYILLVWVNLARNLLWKTWQIRRRLGKLARVINQEGYDVVHIDHYSFSRTVSLVPHLWLPTIVYSHEPSKVRYQDSQEDNRRRQDSLLRQWYTSFCGLAVRLLSYVRNQHDISNTRHAKSVLTNSYYSKETFFQRYRCMARVCRYGVDVETFRPTLVRVEAMILSVGRLVRAKQHDVVIKAVGMIEASRRPRVIITTPEEIERLEDPLYYALLTRVAQEKGVDLEIRLNPSQKELVSLYNQAIAMIFVPIMEPFGLVVLEAMACGTPVIGVREGGIRESVIDGVTGMLVDRDIKQIAAAIEYLQQHEDVRTKMSEQAVECIQTHWTWEQTVDGYENEVLRLLSTGVTSTPRPA